MFNELNLVMVVAFTPLAVLIIVAIRDQVLGRLRPSSHPTEGRKREICALWATAGHQKVR